ncbi:MAG: nitroreductase family protein, partial [Candidatus Omnitrophica bacterium]|nr:nitroreductase family protein [Candidatus Omnitrophota bacterium]
MTFSEIVSRRKSIRRYRPGTIPREDLLKCVEAARLAPSACNSQPWSFIVVDNPGRVRDIGQKIFSGLYNMNRF